MSKGKIIGVVVIVVVLAFAGMLMLGGGGTDTEGPKRLSLQNVTFCTEEPDGYQDYEEQPNSTYTMAEEGSKTFHMYADVIDVSYEEVDQGKKVNIDAYLTVKTPAGDPIFENEQIVNDTQVYSEGDGSLDKYYLIPSFTLQDIGTHLEEPYGDYTVELKIVDAIAENSDMVTTHFTIEQG